MFKKFAIAATAIALTATTASANGFGVLDSIDENARTYEVSVVTASADGFVQLESVRGDVLGQAPVFGGANDDVRVPVNGVEANNQLIAKVIVNGQVEDVQRIWVR